jgi:hypothetical protein
VNRSSVLRRVVAYTIGPEVTGRTAMSSLSQGDYPRSLKKPIFNAW